MPEIDPATAVRVPRPLKRVRPNVAALRVSPGLTQMDLAERSETTQPEAWRFDGREDHKLSTLRMYVAAIG